MNTPTDESLNGQAPHPELHLDDADVPRTGLRPPFAPSQRFSFFVKYAERWTLGIFVLIGLVSFGVIRGCGNHDDTFAHTPLPAPSALVTGQGVIGANVTAHSDRSTVPVPGQTPPLSTPTMQPGAAAGTTGALSASPQLQTQLQASADGLHPNGTETQSYTLPPLRTAPAPITLPSAAAAALQTATVPNPVSLAPAGSPDQIVVSGGVAARSPASPQTPSPMTTSAVIATAPGAPSSVRATSPGEITMQQQTQFAHDGTPPYLASIESQALSQSEVFAGTPIRALLDSSINTTICGTVFAHITTPVRASIKPYAIVIPPYSTLVGRYNCDVQPGQNRLQVSWDYIKMPNGITFPLGGVSASETDGSVGLNADVNDHRGQIYTTTFIASLLDGAQQRLAGVGAGTIVNVGQSAAGSTAGAVNQQLVQTTLQQRPVLSVARGKTFIIQLASTAIMVPYNLTSKATSDAP